MSNRDRSKSAVIIRRVREGLTLSQDTLARALGITKPAIGSWENGRTSPRLEYLLALRQMCSVGEDRKGLDILIAQTQHRKCPVVDGALRGRLYPRLVLPACFDAAHLSEFRKGSQRLQPRIRRLRSELRRMNNRLRLLSERLSDLQREMR